MRLICPNCDAEYAVDDAAIPEGGRDVQCSNCGHGWFQMHPDAEETAEAEAALFGSPVPPPPPVPPARAELDTALPQTMAAMTAVPEPGDDPADDDAAPPLPPPQTQTLDDNLLSVLREEAARETAVRRTEAPHMPQLQTELGLTDTAVPASPDLDLVETGAAGGDRPAPRRDLLPDIEEINSTLRTGSDPRGGDETETAVLAAKRRGGFRAGFVAMLVVAGLLVATYAMAPRIAAYLPASAPVMARYVESVDSARLWLDVWMQKAAGALRGMSGEPG